LSRCCCLPFVLLQNFDWPLFVVFEDFINLFLSWQLIDISHCHAARQFHDFFLAFLLCGSINVFFHLKPHCIQSSRVLVLAGTSKSMLRRHVFQAITRVMAYVNNAVTLWRFLQQCVLAALN
jgi:hypothetical protein